MLPDLDAKIAELRQKRKDRGMTQTALAQLAGVSQSFITKLEAGKVSPGYERVQRLDAALDEQVSTIEDYIEPAVTCSPDTPARDAVRTVIDDGYVFVVRETVPRGAIYPTHLLSYTSGDPDGRTAESIMEGPVTEITPHTSERALRSLLSVAPVIAVVSDGDLIGAITRKTALGNLMEDI